MPTGRAGARPALGDLLLQHDVGGHEPASRRNQATHELATRGERRVGYDVEGLLWQAQISGVGAYDPYRVPVSRS